MNKLLIGLLFFVQVNFAYAVTFNNFGLGGGGYATCTIADFLSNCAGGVSNSGYGGPSLFITYFPWVNPSTGIAYSINLMPNNTAVLKQGSTTVATYPGSVTRGYGHQQGLESGAYVGFITPDNIVVYLSVAKYTYGSSESMACVTYPSMPGYPTFYCYKISSSQGASVFYSNFPYF